MRVIFLLLFFITCTMAQSFLEDELRNAWQDKDINSLQLFLANEVRIFLSESGGNYSRSKAQTVLQEYFEQVEIVAFQYNKRKIKKGVIVANYAYRKNKQTFRTLLYFFTSYNVWNKVNLITSIREIPQDSKKIEKQTSKDDIGKSKEQLIDKYDDPQVMKSDMWEYTQTLSMGCHNVLYITKYTFKDNKVIKVDEQEISPGCEAEAGIW
ncbi:DUF4783 domain-containing protein [Candidatus Uabimicrobium amorphum]|uniref:DUF4440 domain-containing protein n=1 Tax=Uabimicrobium amorphum TaxID=2596890 RepID=A0A5S9ITM9_UABAM|nr:DUF4783 domain-containing protein [Candidatus Uabimicrobium amorphum]BBM87537.1 hypothetical protein UABAM_05949 [Candidatus Uabimicrobium amorphum]